MARRKMIDWKKIELLKSAGHSWEKIAYLARYWGTGDSLKASYYTYCKRTADRNERLNAFPKPDTDPNNPDNWPDFSGENLNLRTGRPVIAPTRSVSKASEYGSTMAWAS